MNQISAHTTRLNRIYPYRWILLGLLVTTLLALADVTKSWYWAQSSGFDFSIGINYAAMWMVYSVWVAIALLIRYLSRRFPLSLHGWSRAYWVHIGCSILIGTCHLILVTFLLWASRGLFSLEYPLKRVLIEMLIGWLLYEVLVYWAALSIFTLIHHRQKKKTNQSQSPNYLKRLPVKQNGETLLLDLDLINWIEAYDNYVMVQTKAKRYILRDTMNRMETCLDPTYFQRIHRSYIVNLNQVQKLVTTERNKLMLALKDGHQLPVSRPKRQQLSLLLQGHKNIAGQTHSSH